MKSQSSLESKISRQDQDDLKIENLIKCSQIKYKLSTICLIILLCIHVTIFFKETKNYVNSYKEKYNILHSRYEFEHVFTTKFIYTIYIVLNNILTLVYYFIVFKSIILFEDKSWKSAVNTVSVLLPLAIFTGFINIFNFTTPSIITLEAFFSYYCYKLCKSIKIISICSN